MPKTPVSATHANVVGRVRAWGGVIQSLRLPPDAKVDDRPLVSQGFANRTCEKVSGLGKVLGLFKTWKLLQAELLQAIFLLRGQMWLSQIEMFMQECAEHPSQVDKLKPKHNPNSR